MRRIASFESPRNCQPTNSCQPTRSTPRSRLQVAEAAVGQARAEQQRARADLERAQAERAQAGADVTYNEALLQTPSSARPSPGTSFARWPRSARASRPFLRRIFPPASGAIVALADLDTLEVEVDVAEANVARLQPSQPAEVIVEAFPERRA